MRILHTSDWHLGRSLHAVSLQDAQAAFIDQLVDIVTSSKIDVVVIAGDVFDRAVPPVQSVELFGEALERIAAHASVFITSGNHDSAIRLGYGAGLFRHGVHVATSVDSVGEGITVEADGVSVRLYPIPYLDPDHARVVLAPSSEEPLARSHQAVMSAAMDRIRADLARQPQPPTASIAVAHAFVTGAASSDSERDISVGGVDCISADVFDGMDYVALGHLHGPQEWRSGKTVVRYSGSPLCYSFSERSHRKCVTLIEVDALAGLSLSEIPIEQPRPMVELRGTLAELLESPDYQVHCDSWVKVVVTDPDRPADLMSRIRAVFPHTLVALHEPPQLVWEGVQSHHDVRTSDPVDIALEFVREVAAREATEREELVLRDAYELAYRRVSGEA